MQTGENTLSILLPPTHHFMGTYEHEFCFTFVPNKPGPVVSVHFCFPSANRTYLQQISIIFPSFKVMMPSEGNTMIDTLDLSPASRHAARLTFADKKHTGSTTESDHDSKLESESLVSHFQRLIG